MRVITEAMLEEMMTILGQRFNFMEDLIDDLDKSLVVMNERLDELEMKLLKAEKALEPECSDGFCPAPKKVMFAPVEDEGFIGEME